MYKCRFFPNMMELVAFMNTANNGSPIDKENVIFVGQETIGVQFQIVWWDP